jgi:carbohydrate-selective porin OprB
MRRCLSKDVLLYFLSFFLACTLAVAQRPPEQSLPGPNRDELGPLMHKHLLGDWGGKRSALEEHGVVFDLQYVADHLWNLKSEQPERFASWNRFRGTVDLDLEQLAHWKGTYVHATAVWQAGGNLGSYLGLLTSPSGMSSANTFRLDSWWIEKRIHDEQLVMRVGQFAGQDFYGVQHFGASFIFEPMGYALGNLATTYESFDPPSTPAMEVRVMPLNHFYAKSMVFAADRFPYSHNPTGLVPQFRGAVMDVSEIGYTPGQKATEVRGFDNVETRKGYSGLYEFGAAYNPGKFTSPMQKNPRPGNYIMYWSADQAIWRVDRAGSKGLDATVSYDWSPADVNRNDTEFTFGLRYNEPIPVRFHNTLSLGYVRNHLSPAFSPPGSAPFKAEHGVELNTMLHVTPSLLAQPVVQYYANVGGGAHRAVVFGLRTKIDF